MSRTTEWLSDAGFGAGWRLVRLLPAKMADALFAAGGDIAAVRGGAGVSQLRRNLRRVVPQADDDELDELTKKAMRSYARYWQEAFRLPVLDHVRFAERFEAGVEGKENLEAALRDGNGAVLALPHSGNWDAAGVWLAQSYGTFSTVAERLRPESLYRRFLAYRESLGFEVLPLDGGARVLVSLTKRLRANGVVCLLADRDLTRSGQPVTFFGEPTRMPSGPAWLAARTSAALLPVTTWFTEDAWGMRIHPRIRVNDRDEIASATQHLADVFAGDIAAHPADWHMLQKLWLADLDEVARHDLDTADASES